MRFLDWVPLPPEDAPPPRVEKPSPRPDGFHDAAQQLLLQHDTSSREEPPPRVAIVDGGNVQVEKIWVWLL
jgi:hypothetical protein